MLHRLFGSLFTSGVFRKYSAHNSRVHVPKRTFWLRGLRLGGPILVRFLKTWVGTPASNTKFWRNIGITAFGLGIPIVYTIYESKDIEPHTKRTRYILASKEDELRLGQDASNFLKEFFQDVILPSNHPLVEQARMISNDIIKVTGRDDLNWELTIVHSQERNMFVLPGGKIFIFTGIYSVLENTDQLAAILGHEISHAIARHGVESLTVSYVWTITLIVIRGLLGETFTGNWGSLFVEMLQSLQYSRKLETEADEIELILMTKANYNPYEMLRFWNTSSKAEDTDGVVPPGSIH
eukprot:TRINITY_DN11044_c0_g1_i1.p1 TRINITY_DN11044_c0_g1~~TRINITY_DN11044_c0_g1_i1.p1  ORF type:complete len:312 (-),score=33.63 TRINITY_DN11044_c0_g1_i1:51-935(-)